VLVTHEGCGAFMADAISRTSDSVGTLMIVPAAGVTHAASGIGEAFLAGVPMLIVAGGIRANTDLRFQLHEVDQHQLLRPITKATFRIEFPDEVFPTFYRAFEIATSGVPGPVFIEVPVDVQWLLADPPRPAPPSRRPTPPHVDVTAIRQAAQMLANAQRPGLFVGWGAVGAAELVAEIAERLQAPVATTLQGLSAFAGTHPLHTGFTFGRAATPAPRHAFKNCDCLLAVGTRFAEIATGSYSVDVPPALIHVDVDPEVLGANYPAAIALAGDSRQVLEALLAELVELGVQRVREEALQARIRRDKQSYRDQWYAHDARGRVNPVRFFDELRRQMPDDCLTVVDDGNHTYLTAELWTVHGTGSVILPTDFNAMGYAVPAAIGAKLANPKRDVFAIVGDGCFRMTCMEIVTARALGLGIAYFVFHDGELSQISQAQDIPLKRKTCTVLGEDREIELAGVAAAVGAEYVAIGGDGALRDGIGRAREVAAAGKPVIVDVAIDYSKRTSFTEGAVRANFDRFTFRQKLRTLGRAVVRRITG
jgi:acetolactate synthase-1/2/3 large subunit